MAHDQGCPHAGADHRLLGKVGCWIQRKLMFCGPIEPVSVIVAFPPYLAINIPIPWATKSQWGVRKSLHLRLGFRYDFNAKCYLISGAIKMVDRALLY